MIIFKHALKRCFAQPLNVLIIFILPVAFIFIPQLRSHYPDGLYLYGMLSLLSAFLLCKPIIEERISKIVLRISASPTDYIAYLSSHLLAYMLILTVQTMIFMLGIYIFWKDIVIDYAFIFSLYLAFHIMAITFCLFWNSLFRSYNIAFGLFSGLVSIMCLVSGISMPFSLIPEGIRSYILVLPTYWLPYGLDALNSGNIKYVLVAHIILLAFSGIFLLIGSNRSY